VAKCKSAKAFSPSHLACKTTNGELLEDNSPHTFAVVVFILALEFVGLHEPSARAHSGLIKNQVPLLRHNHYVQTRPVSCSFLQGPPGT
jgi:hypothetical protein